ncbi:MAG TPA: hemolysin family protein, partial [Isosphaeraceae bacterium]
IAVTAIVSEVALILVLIGVNGLLSLSELAIVSARRPRLQVLAGKGDRGAAAALELAGDPNRFLSTVQVGITLVGTLAGAIGGATLTEAIAGRLERVPRLAPYGEAIGLAVVVAGITYLSLILGELVPKRLALSHPESIARAVAGPLRWLAWIGVPIVRFLGASTEVVLRLLGIRPSGETTITAEEVKALVKEGAQAGVFEPAEHEMVKRVFRLAGRRASTLMTPRAEVVWLDVADPPAELRNKIGGSPHSRFPVCDGTLDNILGVVGVKDLLAQGFRQQPFALKGLLRVPLFLYEGTSALKILETFKASGTHLAVVLDEFGAVQGLLTLNDIVEALVGDLSEGADPAGPKAVRRSDGSWLLDGTLPVDEFHDAFEGLELPRGDYQTLAGFILRQLGRIPATGDRFQWQGLGFEVVDMDGNRIDKVLVSPPGGPAA